eukprot:746239-Hanusia_phi.AAC.8
MAERKSGSNMVPSDGTGGGELTWKNVAGRDWYILPSSGEQTASHRRLHEGRWTRRSKRTGEARRGRR